TWVLSNHDVIRHATRYGFPPEHRFGEGLARDEHPDTELGLHRARAATLLMLALPGSAYLYQGEELGLPEVADIPDELREDPAHRRGGVPGRDGCRVPIPWEQNAPAYGFSPSGESWLPQPEAFGPLAVDEQTGVPSSTLEMYRRALHLRRELDLGRHGDGVTFVDDAPAGVLALVHEAVLVAVNTTEEDVDLAAIPGADGEVLASSVGEASGADLPAGVLPGEAALWVRRSSWHCG
ncbi:MAG: DUF3459 domain-containing protein, partial [Brachybacterium sp.]|nr:DUF3459 domain-containing protein [Brachybacterium sp.]